jgi:hypothetical protein
MEDQIGDTAHRQFERAEYIERMSQELSRLASAANLPMLAFILDMATEEAALVRNGEKVRLAPQPATASRQPRSLVGG